MKKEYLLISVSLMFCLFIYLFFRTERTVITQLFISIVSFDDFQETRRNITSVIRLPDFVIYSLPEGLWVFCITLTSRSLFINIGSRELSLLFAPLVAAIGMELAQLLQLTNGRFDAMDIVVSVVFWIIATYLMKPMPERQNLFRPFTRRSFLCIASYLIVYLAHVWK